VFLSKASIRKVPLLGKINVLAGTIFVERGNRTSSDKAVKALTQTLKNGRSVLVFPEGTRSADGSLKSFKKGAFHLAAAAGAPVVPMHISGTHSHLPPSAWGFQKSDEAVVVRLGAPLASNPHDVAATMEEAQSAVSALSTAE
jgi:1-acyl-sn-glycerol-3-phosphate acyltransferase